MNINKSVKNRNIKVIAAVLITMLLIVSIASCKVTEKKSTTTISTSETTEPTESSYGRIKGVVIGAETTTTEPTVTETTAVETTAATEPSTTTETTAAAPTKVPTRKPTTKKKATTKKTTKKKTTKKKSTTKKTTPTQTSNTYKYCTCDAKVSYGVSGGTHTFTGLTAQQSNGKWVLTSASTSKIVSWLNSNVKDKSGKPNWQRYSATITNTRNYRNNA